MLRPQFARSQISDLDLEEKHVGHMLKQLTIDASGWTESVDLGPIFFRLTMDSATEFLFGQSTNSQVAHDPRNRSSISPHLLRWSDVATSFDRGTSVLGTRARLEDFYWAYNPRYFRDDCVKIRQFADFCIEQALQKRQFKKADTYIFLDELLDKTQDTSEVRSQLLNIFLAGRDTTAGLLGWTIWSLARNRDVFDKLRTYILEDFGGPSDGNSITFEGLKSCTYLQHVLQETLRLYPSVPFNSRQATRNTTLPHGGGPDGSSPVYVRKNQVVGYSVYVMHRNKDLWGEDAEMFNPDRWVGRKSGWDYLPFNGGPRVCLGQQFALTEAAYVITRLLQQFDRIENTDPENEPWQQYSLTSAPKQVFVRLHKA
ncbi:hypothetical protein B0A52_02506 [Exophiala mesophila]|uniref:Uncharacterized protein n=1 Tax=Exophiala mesophila TaxID=212818 RepID=A0A438ND70_EXOME|nr:hypothetical protein B0A52_02506 [Exophiala mesophila]